MSERKVISETSGDPLTTVSAAGQLRSLGLCSGMLVIVHTSLSKLGWVCGGAQAIVDAILAVLGREGTLVMPAHTSHLSDPSQWSNPPVPENWWPTIRAELPAFQPAITPSYGMGAVVECFRKYPGVVRSNHPQASFCALGPLADEIIAEHHLHDTFGDTSPLAKVYARNGHVLLLAVEHDKNTSLHLAEHRAVGDSMKKSPTGAPVMVENHREWLEFSEREYDTSDFNQIGEAFESQTEFIKSGRIGMGVAKLMPQVPLVDFAVDWIRNQRADKDR